MFCKTLHIERAMESHTHVSQNPGKNKPQTLPITVLPLGPKALLEGIDNSTAEEKLRKLEFS